MTFARDLANFADTSANNLTFRNLIINGAMQIAQRGTSTASITTDGYYTADRYTVIIGALGTWTQSVENDAPTGSGFRKSLKMLCTTADALPASSDYLQIRQNLEGQNLQAILKGTSSAKPLTLSFWIKSNKTGTYICHLRDNDNSRSVSASYTVSASDTWEKKIITIPADVTGILDNDNNNSLSVNFWLAAGSNYTSGTLQTTWGSATDANYAVGITNLAAATNNYWQITGVQLEIGSSASAYEFKPFDIELRQCQRYYQKSFEYSITPANNLNVGGNYALFPATGTNVYNQGRANFIVPLRANPSTVVLYTYNSAAGKTGNWFTDTSNSSATGSTAATLGNASTLNINVTINNGNGFNTGNTYGIHWTAEAEL